jgi:hypothetical protein
MSLSTHEFREHNGALLGYGALSAGAGLYLVVATVLKPHSRGVAAARMKAASDV